MPIVYQSPIAAASVAPRFEWTTNRGRPAEPLRRGGQPLVRRRPAPARLLLVRPFRPVAPDGEPRRPHRAQGTPPSARRAGRRRGARRSRREAVGEGGSGASCSSPAAKRSRGSRAARAHRASRRCSNGTSSRRSRSLQLARLELGDHGESELRRRARRRRRGGRTSTLMFPMLRTTISPSRTTARGPMRCTPRMPTSGWLTSGVTSTPASLPALVTVNVDPRSSSGASVPVRAFSASASTSARSSSRGRDRRSRGRRGRRDPGRSGRRCRGRNGRGRRSRRPRAGRSARGTSCSGERRRPENARQQLLQIDAREVAFLDERDGGHLAVRARQVLDDLPPHAAHLLSPPLALDPRRL